MIIDHRRALWINLYRFTGLADKSSEGEGIWLGGLRWRSVWAVKLAVGLISLELLNGLPDLC